MTRSCTECGVAWGGDARWCAACGAALVALAPTVAPEGDEDGPGPRRDTGIRRRLAGVVVVLAAVGALLAAQIVAEGPADDGVDGEIGLPDSPLASPPAQLGTGRPVRTPEPQVPPTCSRDGAALPGCPQVLRTGIEPLAPVVSGLLLTADGVTLQAVDVRTGEIRWEYDAGRLTLVRAEQVGGVLVLLLADGLHGLDPGTGLERWHVPGSWVRLSGVEAGPSPPQVIVEGRGELSARSPLDGQELWTVPTPELPPQPSGASLVGATDAVLIFEVYAQVGSQARTVGVDRATGATTWERERIVDGPTGLVGLSAGHIVFTSLDLGVPDAPARRTVTVVNATTGQDVWERTTDLPVDMSDGLDVVGDLALLHVSGRLQAMELSTGDTRWMQEPGRVLHTSTGPLPLDDEPGSGSAPALVVLRGERMQRLDLDTGEVVWTHPDRQGSGAGIVTPTRVLRFAPGGGRRELVVHDVQDGRQVVAVQHVEPNVVSADPLVILDDVRLLRLPEDRPGRQVLP